MSRLKAKGIGQFEFHHQLVRVSMVTCDHGGCIKGGADFELSGSQRRRTTDRSQHGASIPPHLGVLLPPLLACFRWGSDSIGQSKLSRWQINKRKHSEVTAEFVMPNVGLRSDRCLEVGLVVALEDKFWKWFQFERWRGRKCSLPQ